MDEETESAPSEVNKPINKNHNLNPKIYKVQGKHMVIEIIEGRFMMNEFGCNDLLRKVRASYDISDSKCYGAITYRDCKMILSDAEFVYNVDTRFESILVRLFPVSCIILKNSVLVVVNENMKMDGFIRDLCKITHFYGHFNSDVAKNRTPTSSETIQNSNEQFLAPSEETQNTFNFNLPFEICVLECCFITALSHLESVIYLLHIYNMPMRIYYNLDGMWKISVDLVVFEEKNKILEDKVYNNKKFKDISIILHDLKHPVSNMNEMSRGFEELINEILSCDENIKVLEFSNHILHYGSETMRNNLTYRPVNHDLQFLLEYFDQEIEMLGKRARTLENSLVHIERYINLELAITRNEMMRLDVMCSILGVSFGVGACLSGLFGMNVINGLEQSRYAFTSITLAFLSVLFVAIYVTRVLQVKHRV
uniref:Magnesium transporter n=1 Tax=Theileria annulata TaxID=5874 RepID=A0A3B0N1H4_THEAN